MSVSAADVAVAQEVLASAPPNASDGLEVLTSLAEVMAYVVALARHHGFDEADCVELVCRVTGMSRSELRHCERIMRPLGYVSVANRLKLLSRRKAIS